MLVTVLGLRHSTTDGFKDFRAAELRDQQTERVPLGGSLGSYVAARPCAPVDDARELEFAQGAIHGGPGYTESRYEFRLTRQALARAIYGDTSFPLTTDGPMDIFPSAFIAADSAWL